MKITPKELRDVLDYIADTPNSEQTDAKVAVLDAIKTYFRDLSDEEKEEFPAEDILELTYCDYSQTVTFLSQDKSIDALKHFYEENLELYKHRTAPPYIRAMMGQLAAMACDIILDYTSADCYNDIDIWVYRGLEAANLAFDLFLRLEEVEDAYTTLKTKINILIRKSYHEAEVFALQGVRSAPTEELRNEFADFWMEIYDKRFKLYFDKGTGTAAFVNSLPLPPKKIKALIEENEDISGLIDKSLCTLEPYYDRSLILFVEQIKDVALPEIAKLTDEVSYVFLLDRIPAGLHFDDGHPKPNVIYVVDEDDDTSYHELSDNE